MGDAPRKSRISITQAEAAAALLQFLDAHVAALVEQVLRARGEDADDPLIRSDRLGPNNRIVLGLIKRGEIRGVLIGNRWHVRRSEWARYVAQLEAEQGSDLDAAGDAGEGTAADEIDDERDADRVLEDLGFMRRLATPRHGAARPPIDARPGRSRQRRKSRAR